MLSWNSWYNPLDNASNVIKGVGSTLTGGAVGSQYNTMSNPQTVYNPTPSAPKPSVLGAQSDPGAMYYDSSSGRIATPDGLRADGSAWPTGGSGGGGATAPAKPAYDPFEMELLNRQLGTTQDAIGRLDRDQSTGLANLLQSYQRGLGQIGTDRNQAQSQFEQTKTRNTQDYTDTRAGVRRDAGNLYNSIQRILGQAGAGSSSFAREVAPFAVAQSAAARFDPLQTQFGRNMGDLQMGLDSTMGQLTDAERQLEEDKKNKERELRSGIDQNRLSLTDRLNALQMQRGQLKGGDVDSLRPQLDANENTIRTILDRISSNAAIYQNPKLNVARTAFKAPNLERYDYNRFGAPQLQGGGYDPRADYTRPFAPIARDEEELR